MQITGLVRNRLGRINVNIDGAFTFSASNKLVLDHKLYNGLQISPEKLDELKDLANVDKLYFKTIALIARRPHSIAEIQAYLVRKNQLSEKLAREVIDRLISENLLDDVAFAQWWLESRARRQKSSKKQITAELRGKGIDQEIIESIFSEFDYTKVENEVIKKLYLKKRSLLAQKNLTELQVKQKIEQYLMSKGFSWSQIQNVII